LGAPGGTPQPGEGYFPRSSGFSKGHLPLRVVLHSWAKVIFRAPAVSPKGHWALRVVLHSRAKVIFRHPAVSPKGPDFPCKKMAKFRPWDALVTKNFQKLKIFFFFYLPRDSME
jgi:hypothetical protein